MKLKEYLESLQKLVKFNPEALEYDVCYSRDDEGNGFDPVNYTPTLGKWDGERWGEFTPSEQFINAVMQGEMEEDEAVCNSVCLN